jgi:hypothetical protein
MNLHVSMTPTQARLAAEHKARQRRLGVVRTAAQKEAEKRLEQKRRTQAAMEAWYERIEAEEGSRKKLWRISWRTMVALAQKRQAAQARAAIREALALNSASSGIFADTLSKVAEKYGVTVPELKGPARTPLKLVQARFEACWLGNKFHRLPLTVIARLMGGRDHTTVLHSVRKYEAFQRYVKGGEPAYSMRGRNSLVIPELVITEDCE